MSRSKIFQRLGAPLRNVMWSWGSQRADGTIFLRVWQDETKPMVDGRLFARLANHHAYAHEASSAGYSERVGHIEALKQGAEGYGIFCRAKDPKARPREIREMDERDLGKFGEIVVIDGDEWVEIVSRVPARELMLRA